MRNRYIETAENISFENAHELERTFVAEYPEQAGTGAMYGIRLSTLQINSSKASSFVLQAAMIYGAVVLIVICLTILSLPVSYTHLKPLRNWRVKSFFTRHPKM